MYNRVLTSILLLGMTSVCLAQGSSDLLRLSQRYPTGTARAMSMGGAFGALGADMSVLGLNPAGIGAYRGDEILVTPMLSIRHTDATLNGETDTDSKVTFPFNSFGFVSTVNLSPSRTKSLTMGMSYARIADFNQDISITSRQATSSILDEFAYTANNPVGNNDWDPLMPAALGQYEGMAFDVYAIDTAYFFGANPYTGQPDAMPYFQLSLRGKEVNEPGHYFNHPFYLVLNLAVGGFFPDMPAAEKYPERITADDPSFQKVTALPVDGSPAKMYVDYIRVYKK